GMVAVMIYGIHVWVGGLLWKGYDPLQQPISDLTATGAPNRVLLLWLTSVYGVLALLFAISLVASADRRRHPFVFWGGLSFVLLHGVSISYNFFPQDLPGSPATFAGTMHLVVTGLIVPFTLLSPFLIGSGLVQTRLHKRLGQFSILCGLLILAFGTATALFFVRHLPYFGLVERMNIGTLQIWTFVLSYQLTRHHGISE
ncbi:MAG: DUF998 domain-containing protein, partial [Marinilabiliales bacterium]|nr:DUF998 domain-containing protein [Marinilabiliales bacterium]